MSILLRLSTLFLLALSVLLSTVSARPQVNNVYKRKASPTGTEIYLTNAARMAAGLGPLTPRNLFDPTRVKVARDANPSLITLSGRIKVTQASNGHLIGYVDKNYASGRLPVNTNANAVGSHLTVSFTKPVSVASLFNILITSNGNPSQPNLGFAHASNPTLMNSLLDSTTLTGTNPTTSGGVAAQVGNGLSGSKPYSESPIWSYDASNSRLSNTWLNPSSPGSSTGVSVAVKTYYSASGGLMQSRGNLGVFGLPEVILTLV